MINYIIGPVLKFIPENNRFERIWKLAQVDFKKRYYNDKLGLFWALLNPLFQITIYYYVFTYFLVRPVENFALFLYAGMLIWLTFSQASMKGLNIISTKKYLLENIQFNKLDLFYSQLVSSFMGLGFNLVAFIVLCYILGVRYSWDFFLLPILFINLALFSLGTSMILATLKIYLKDIVHLWTIVMLLGFWTSGIFFHADRVLEQFPSFYYLQPFLGLIDNMRCITGIFDGDPEYSHKSFSWSLAGINMAYGIVVLAIGVFVFKRYSHKAIELN